jgi:anti-sigma regulatory factor (Ser/Thr protein kinase)
MFVGKAEEIAQARRFARVVCGGHESADTVELVVSELGTNAVEHTASGGPSGLFVVEVEVEADHVRVAVVDMGADTEPFASLDDPADVAAVSGRGLCIVETVSAKWGSEPVRAGRRVWAVIAAGA